MNSRSFVMLAALFGFLSVALGAFGTHALDSYFESRPDLESAYHTAAQYMIAHALALIGAAWAVETYANRWAHLAGALFAAGIVLFSGSLFVYSLFDLRIMGAVAPLGGAALLAGWVCLGLAGLKH